MRAALLQLCSGDDPEANLRVIRAVLRKAAEGGAQVALTPEVSNCVSADRARQQEVLYREDADPTLAALRTEARELGIWLVIGSLALKTEDADGRFANRCFVIDPQGRITARYDKIHMFDVEVSPTETYRESAGYRPGNCAVLADVAGVRFGLSICYDIRFPHLYRTLAQAGAQVLTVPSAFSPVTGAAHWESLLRARAIETGCYVLAPAQTGTHAATQGRARQTHGHSLVVSPWGEVIADGGTEPGVIFTDLDITHVAKARAKVPSLSHDRAFDGP